MLSGGSKKARKDWNRMGHISFWPMLMTLIFLGQNIDTIQKNNEALLDARKEVGLEVNPEETKYILM
jgi:hypothetical protein